MRIRDMPLGRCKVKGWRAGKRQVGKIPFKGHKEFGTDPEMFGLPV